MCTIFGLPGISARKSFYFNALPAHFPYLSKIYNELYNFAVTAVSVTGLFGLAFALLTSGKLVTHNLPKFRCCTIPECGKNILGKVIPISIVSPVPIAHPRHECVWSSFDLCGPSVLTMLCSEVRSLEFGTPVQMSPLSKY